jgi:hypothetical protein
MSRPLIGTGPAVGKPTNREGWLVKKAVRTLTKMSWKKRYVKLDATTATVTYMKTYAGKPVHTLQLDGACIATRVTEHQRPAEFVLKPAAGVSGVPEWAFYACATDDDEAEAWVSSLRAVIRALQGSSSSPMADRVKAAGGIGKGAATSSGSGRGLSLRLPPPPPGGTTLPPPPPAGSLPLPPPPPLAISAPLSLFDLVRKAEGA